MATITPFLWFDGRAGEALEFYRSVFPEAEETSRINDAEGGLLSVSLRLLGQELILFNGGPLFRFSEGISLYVQCRSQEEIDYYWEKLSEGGEEEFCGWLKDRFGVSWQVAPPGMDQLLADTDPERSGRVMEAMLQMKKLVVGDLQQAYLGKAVSQ